MRNKIELKRLCQQCPEQIFVRSRDPLEFRAWLDDQRKGRPLRLELGMGTGHFLISQAKKYPEVFFLGLEIKEDRVYKAYRRAAEPQLSNIAFLQEHAAALLKYKLPPVEVLYSLFADPWPKKKHIKNRLTSPSFLRVYQELLAKNGELIFKTDQSKLFEFTKEALEKAGWKMLDEQKGYLTAEEERTAYESRFLRDGGTIFYLKASAPPV
ncbi:MAG: tRNA (guanosine(46)-N7)-methyltransferase TrmB [bacterium]|nr:tRNA (guanosine(46)-N7)-methyltransferase TrmB [bacterium]